MRRYTATYTWQDLDTTGHEDIDVRIHLSCEQDDPSAWDIDCYDIVDTDNGVPSDHEAMILWELFNPDDVEWGDLRDITELERI